MTDVGKLLTLAGVVFAVLGLCVWGMGRLGWHGLPGDIKYESERMRVFVPIVTCLLLSLLATGAMWLWSWLGRK